MDILDEYCEASGQRINYDKSSLFFSLTPPMMCLPLYALLRIPTSTNPGTYLGLPSIWGNSKKEALRFVIERVIKKVLGWKGKNLTMAGREVLIKFVALAIPTYPMQCFKFPVSICKELNAILCNFWWGFSDKCPKHHWRSWNRLCYSKTDGGIGFRDLEDFNKSLLAKQVWRMIENPNALWVKVLKAKYFPVVDILKARRGLVLLGVG